MIGYVGKGGGEVGGGELLVPVLIHFSARCERKKKMLLSFLGR